MRNDRDAEAGALSELIGDLVEPPVVSGDEHEVETVTGKQLRELVANPTGRPGHESGSLGNAAADHERLLLDHHAAVAGVQVM